MEVELISYETNSRLTSGGRSAREDKADKNQQLPKAPYLISLGSIRS